MTKVIVGMGTCGLSAGARQVYEKLEGILEANPGAFELSGTSCIGMCYREPLVEIRSGDERTVAIPWQPAIWPSTTFLNRL